MSKSIVIPQKMIGSLIKAHDVAAGVVRDHDYLVLPIGLFETDFLHSGQPNGVIFAFDLNRLDRVQQRFIKLILMNLEKYSGTDEFPWDFDRDEIIDNGDRSLESLYRDVVNREFL